MIVPMKKVTLLVLDSKRGEELRAIKRLGVLHPRVEDRSDQITSELLERRDALERAIGDLSDIEEFTRKAADSDETIPEPPPAEEQEKQLASLAQAEAVASRVAEHSERATGLVEKLNRLQLDRSQLLPWGEFSPDEVRELSERGVDVRLFESNTKTYRKLASTRAIEISTEAGRTRFVVAAYKDASFADEVAARNDTEEFQVPELGIQELDAQIAAVSGQLADERAQLIGMLGLRAQLAETLRALDERLHDHGIYLNLERTDRVAYISGYVPEDRLQSLRAAATENGWGYMITEPESDESVPTKLHNPRWIETIRPIFSMLGVVPGYRERDISLPFLAFFTVFVGMIIGDAGYGALVLLAGIVMMIGSKARSGAASQGAKLATVLGVSVVAWGAITGNWFGYAPIADTPPFSYLVIDALDTASADSGRLVQLLCFTLAVVHLSLAHIWSFLVFLTRKPAIKAFGEIGWLGVVIGLYLLVLNLFLDVPMPAFTLPLILGGLGLVFIFAEQRNDRGFFRTILYSFTEGLLPTIFSGIGAFSDVISYIRLYAIGIASVEIAQAFNEMAAGGGLIGMIIILALGHTLNLIMGGLAVIVHGVRLNVLEFAGHLGMEWTGIAYTPFSEERRSQQ